MSKRMLLDKTMIGAVSCLAALACFVSVPAAQAANPAGNLRIELISGYNFVIDSNVETPATYAPRSAYLGATYYNDGVVALTNVYAYIGNFTNNTPGIYPSRTHAGLTGTFALQHEGGSLGASDATRYLGTIEPGESKTVYWLVSYPNLDDAGNDVALGIKPGDDLWLYFDVWGKAYEGATLRTADVRRQVFMRRMLSAMANKIAPNGANKVPQEYQDLLQQYAPSWTNNLVDGSPGSAIITEGIWYDLGNINQGFDNDGDLIPDYNAWMQPVGDPTIFDAGCFRLVRTYAMVVIKRSAGDVVILAEDQLYFSNLPDDNNGAVGYVRYEFMPLCSGASATLSPYQAVASGSDNEKFNGDFGATLGDGLVTQPTSAQIDKQVDLATAGANSNLNYTVAFTNSGGASIGQPDVGLPVVISDSIPGGTTYVAGSAAAGNTLPANVTAYTLFYSTNNATSWSQVEPAASAVTDIQWWLSDPLGTGTAGVVTFTVTVDDPAIPLIYNVAGLGLGSSAPFLEDDATTKVTGTRLISGTVFADIGTGGGTFGDGSLNGTEAGISNVTVTLYYDANTNGILDAGDISYATTTSATNGTYSFTGLADGKYLVVVNSLDPDIPTGYTLTSAGTRAVTLAGSDSTGNNFGVAPSLALTKTGPALIEKGEQVVYTIVVTNNLPGTLQPFSYTLWATNLVGTPSARWSTTTNAVSPRYPDGQYAIYAPSASSQNKEPLSVDGFMTNQILGTVTNVVLEMHLTNNALWVDDTVRIEVTNRLGQVIYTHEAVGNVFTTGVYRVDLTTNISWTAAHFTTNRTVVSIMYGTKTAAADTAARIGLDQVSFIVKTDQPTTTLTNVPLFDYYDTSVLQFTSAVPAITSSDTNGPAPNTGRLFWSNVGPLLPLQGTNITVTFNVIGPAGNAGTITTNRAAITNATFITGVPANQAFAQATSAVPATASLGDTIFWDANRSGSQDGSEAGVSNVTVQLYTNGTLVASTTTDANGFYLFTGLMPDTYTVLVVTNGGVNYPLNGASLSAHPDNDGVPIGEPLATVSNNFTTVTLIGGQDYRGADFGYVPPGATIGGALWIDFNNDGIANGGESTIPFITVTLYDGSGNAIATNTTDADGNYLFYGLTNGTYNVVVSSADPDFPAGILQTVDPDGVTNNIATNIVISSSTIATIGGSAWTAGDLEVNFGYRYTGNNTLSGTVGMDDPDAIDGRLNGTNTTGVASNETAFAGVTVYAYLWNDNSNGVVNSGETVLLGTTVTAANGDYSFANLPNGVGSTNEYYIVSLVAPYNFLSLTTTNSATPATLLVKTQNAQGHTLSAYQAVPVAPSITNMDFAFISVVEYDFGDLPDSYRTTLANNGPRHIIVDTNSPTLFLGSAVDTENNGLPSVGANGDDTDGVDDEDGVFVKGIWQNGTSDAMARVQVGAGSGWLVGYVDFNNSGAFDNANELVVSQAVSTNVNGGLYEFNFNVPAGTLSTTATTTLYSRWRLLPSQPFLPALAFQGEASNGEVEDYRWYFHVIGGSVLEDDGSTNNVFDGADSPQAGVVVNLYTNGTLVATTVTGLDGSYYFYGLQDGDYRVSMAEPVGATSILDVDGNGNTYTNIAVTVAGASVYDRDFLLSTNASLFGLSGTVFDDDGFGVVGNGNFTGPDVPVGGVEVALYRDLNTNGVADANEFIGTATTDSSGDYAFNNLPQGAYLLIMTPPGGATSTTDIDGNGNGSALIQATLSVSDVTGRDFLVDGTTVAGRIGDRVWLDEDGDGIQDAGEDGIPNVTIEVLSTNGTVVATAVTDTQGQYLTLELPAGTYTVRVATNSLAAGLRVNQTYDPDATTNHQTTVVLAVGDVYLGADFGYNWSSPADVLNGTGTGAIGDRVWIDANGDGVQDPGEPGLAGITVTLYYDANTNGFYTNVYATTTTDAAGNYIFDSLPSRAYVVAVTPPGGYTQTGDPDATLDHKTTIPVILAPGDVFVNADFGYQSASSSAISGTVYFDADANENLDGVDYGIAGVTVALLDTNGTIIATTTTDTNGVYTFTGLPAGDYTVWANDTGNLLGGLYQTEDQDAMKDARTIVTVDGVNDVNDVDFGYAPDGHSGTTGLIGDTIFLDRDLDGLFDPGEGLQGVAVKLYDATGTILLASTVTDANGNYYFPGLATGTYVVKVDTTTLPGGGEGLTNSVDPDGGTASLSTVTLSQDALSGPLPVSLGSAAAFAVLAGSTVTSTGGAVVDGELGVSPGTAVTGFPPGVITNGTIHTGDAAAAQAQLDLTAAYGDAAGRTPTATIPTQLGGTTRTPGVYNSGDGTFGITGTLTLDAQGDPNAVFIFQTASTLITAADSLVVLTNGAQACNVFWVVGSSATVGVDSALSGSILAYTSATLTTGASVDGRVLAITGAVTLDTNSITLPLTAGPINLDQDFGYTASTPNTISGTLWEDRNADGMLGAGETNGLAGTTVLLTDTNGNVVATAVTDADGNYAFTGLPDGTYRVDVTDAANLLNGWWHSIGPTPGADNNSQSDPYAVTVSGGETNTTADFGYYVEGAALGNRIWNDANINGLQDEGEVGMAGVLVALTIGYPSAVTSTVYTVSDTNGFYGFGNLLLDENFNGSGAGEPIHAISAPTNLPGYKMTGWSVGGDDQVDSDPHTGVVGAAVQGQSNTAAGATPGVETAAASYDFGYWLKSTRAMIDAFSASVENDRVVVAWRTQSESGSVGFDLYREAAKEGGARLKVNRDILLALLVAPQGGTYRFVDRSAPLSGALRYTLVEYEHTGSTRRYGPFDVELAPRAAAARRAAFAATPAAADSPDAYTATAHRPAAAAAAAPALRMATKAVAAPARGFPLRMGVPQAGVYRVTAATLADGAGVSPAEALALIESGALALSSQGRAVAWWRAGGELRFYAQELTSVYSRENVYWLDRGAATLAAGMAAPAPDVAAPSADFESVAHAEENLYAPTTAFKAVGDVWVWEYLVAGHAAVGQRTFSIACPAPTGGGAAHLDLHLVGGTESDAALDHHLDISLNGVVLGSAQWDGRGRHSVRLSVDAARLNDGANTVTIKALLNSGVPVSIVYLDSLDLTYRRRYRAENNALAFTAQGTGAIELSGFAAADIHVLDISEPHTPVTLLPAAATVQDGGYAVRLPGPVAGTRSGFAYCEAAVRLPTSVVCEPMPDLSGYAHEADAVIIAPEEFLATVEELAHYRRSKGFKVEVVSVEAVYREFNYGLRDPRAIRRFLATALRNWKQAPRYVTLAGAGSYDYKDDQAHAGNHLPPLMSVTPDGVQFSDAALADTTCDGLPEMAIGRLPARTASELQAAIAKIKAYEADGSWKQRIALVADNSDDGGAFAVDSEVLAAQLPPQSEITRAYLGELPLAEVRATAKAQLAGGVHLFNYVGHAGFAGLADENILRSSDIDSLGNATRPALVMAATCDIAQSSVPGFSFLGADMITKANGASAVWSAVGPAYNHDNVTLAENIYRSLFGSGTDRLGDAISDALRIHPDGAKLSERYALLGDPALAVGSADSAPRAAVEPGVMGERERALLSVAPVIQDQAAAGGGGSGGGATDGVWLQNGIVPPSPVRIGHIIILLLDQP